MEFTNAPAPRQHPQVLHTKRKKTFPRKFLVLAVAVVLLLIIAWQQIRVLNLQSEVAELKKTQLPTQKFNSYVECESTGGVLLNIDNNASGCVSGEKIITKNKTIYKAFLRFSAESLPRILDRQKSDRENAIINKFQASTDLVEFLRYDFWGCPTQGEYDIVKEVPNRFALMKYRCITSEAVNIQDSSYIIGIKLADGWSLISPANYNMDKDGMPSCLLVDMFKISKELTPKCFENTDYSDNQIEEVSYQ